VFSVALGDIIDGQDAGIVYPLVGDLVWDDTDADGLQDSEELGIEGVTVQLLNEEDDVVDETVTDEAGYYEFPFVFPGTYRVKVLALNWFSPANQGSDDNIDSDVDSSGRSELFAVVAGDERRDIDAGLIDTPMLSISDVSLTEGNSGTINATFTVTLSAASANNVTVNYTTANGTAISPSDYYSTSNTLTFDPFETSKTITVPVIGETIFESNEYFHVHLSNAVNAAIADGQGVGTILNDDPIPTITISDVSQSEGDSDTTNYSFTVSLSNPSSQTISVSFATANGSAASGSDYSSTTDTLTFDPLDTSKTVTVSVSGDSIYEFNENFFVNLSNAINATIGDNQGVGTIVNDDDMPTLTISDESHIEGNGGSTSYDFTVTLTGLSEPPVTVNFATVNGTADDGSDFGAVNNTLTFLTGETTKTISVSVNGDAVEEDDETFSVSLSNPVNATLDDSSGLGTILNDDTSVSMSDVSQSEGESGSTTFTFTVTLSKPSALTVTVPYNTADGSATTSDGDYGSADGTLTFEPGATSQDITVSVNGDNKYEPDESFAVNAGAVVNATVADGVGLGTIVNDDQQPTISITDASGTEGNSGATTLTFTVTLSNPSWQTITVEFATANGSATAGSDYEATSGTLTFAPGGTSQTISVTIYGDTEAESGGGLVQTGEVVPIGGPPGPPPPPPPPFGIGENFFLNLSSATNATLLDPQGIGVITDDD
jgi:hypothetical protein